MKIKNYEVCLKWNRSFCEVLCSKIHGTRVDTHGLLGRTGAFVEARSDGFPVDKRTSPMLPWRVWVMELPLGLSNNIRPDVEGIPSVDHTQCTVLWAVSHTSVCWDWHHKLVPVCPAFCGAKKKNASHTTVCNNCRARNPDLLKLFQHRIVKDLMFHTPSRCCSLLSQPKK